MRYHFNIFFSAIFKIISTFTLLFIFHFSLIGQTGNHINARGITLLADQDFFSPIGNEDRNYTMGVGIGVMGEKTGKDYLVLPFIRKSLDRLFQLDSLSTDQYINTMSLLSSNFTPLDLVPSTPVTNDRPYGSFLGFSSSQLRVVNGGDSNLRNDFSILSTFNLGLLGLRVGKEVQSFIHEKHLFGSQRPIPQGWHNQISNGGELTLLYRLEVRKPMSYIRRNKRYILQLTSSLEGMAGYYTNAAAGLQFRLGYFSDHYWMGNNTTSAIISHNPANMSWLNFYVFAGVKGRLVLYNALLQGQFKANDFAFDETEISRFIRELEVGAVLRLGKRLSLLYSINSRTPEFRAATARSHYWGTAMVSFVWPVN